MAAKRGREEDASAPAPAAAAATAAAEAPAPADGGGGGGAGIIFSVGGGGGDCGGGGGGCGLEHLTHLPRQSAADALDLIPEIAEEVRLHEPYVRLFLGTRDAGVGHLFLTSERVAWIGAEDGTGVQLPYEAVVVHAVGVDPECFTNPTVMLQITPAVEGGGGDGDDDENGGGEVATSDALGGAAGRRRRDSGGAVAVSSLLTVDDLRFVPANAAAVEAIYEALSAGVASHPVGSDDEGDDDDGADGGEGGEDDGEDGGDLAGLLAFAAAGGRGFYGAPPPVEGQFDAADDDGDAGTGAAAPP